MISMSKTFDNHGAKQRIDVRDTVRKNRDKLIREDEKGRVMRKTVPVMLVISFSVSLYTFRLGRKSGYLDGVKEGYVKAGQELVSTWREHSEQLRLSKQ